MDCLTEALRQERQDEELFLLSVQKGIADDVRFVERGGTPMNYRGSGRAEILASLRRHFNGVGSAIQHVRSGGPLTDIVAIVCGRNGAQ